MPLDPITTRTDIVVRARHGLADMVQLSQYEPPAGDDGLAAEDRFRNADHDVARRVIGWLSSHHPGYPWAVIADLRQGVVRFNIPILMGVETWYVVNLMTTELADGVLQGAGEILERYGQRLGQMDDGLFLDARLKHSRLLVGSRPVPT